MPKNTSEQKPVDKWVRRFDSSARLGLIELAVSVLGGCRITIHEGGRVYSVHDVATGDIRIVGLEDRSFTCRTCKSTSCIEACIVNLYAHALMVVP